MVAYVGPHALPSSLGARSSGNQVLRQFPDNRISHLKSLRHLLCASDIGLRDIRQMKDKKNVVLKIYQAL